MEADIQELKILIQQLNVEQPDKLIAEQISINIISLLEKLFMYLGEMQFSTLLNNYIIEPLIPRFNEIESLVSNSRIAVKRRKDFAQVNFMIDYVFSKYEHFVKENQYFEEYKRRAFESKDEFKNLILQDLDANVDLRDFSDLINSKKDLLQYLKELDKADDFQTLNYRVNQIYDEAKKISNATATKINDANKQIDEIRFKISSDSDYKTDYEGRTYKEILTENLLDYDFQREIYENHYKELQNLLQKIESRFKFVKTKNENDLLNHYFEHSKIIDFIRFEDKLIDNGYLVKNELGLKWNKSKVLLVNFCRYIEINGYLKQYKDISTLITFLENRYKENVGDQRKPSKFKGRNVDINFDFEFLK